MLTPQLQVTRLDASATGALHGRKEGLREKAQTETTLGIAGTWIDLIIQSVRRGCVLY